MEKQIKDKLIEEYWLKRLDGNPAKLSLPEGINVSPTGERVTLQMPIDEEIVQSLRKLAKGADNAFFILVMSCLNMLLYKYTGQTDLVIGTTPPNKSGEILFCRTEVTGDATLKELIAGTNRTVMEAFKYSEYSFSEIYSKLQKLSGKTGLEIFNIAFVDENYQGISQALEQFPLTFIYQQNGTLQVNYNSALYGREIVENFSRNFIFLLANLANKLNQKLKDIEIICPEEVEKLNSFNATFMEIPTEMSLHQFFLNQANTHPAKTAVVYAGEQMTYGELEHYSKNLAVRLREAGVGPDKIVGLMAEVSFEVVIGMLAILRAGGAFLPIDPDFPEDRIDYLLKDSRTEVLLTKGKYAGKINFPGLVFDLEDKTLFSGDGELPELTHENHLAYVIYTSGTTGKPKGVMVEHGSIINQFAGLLKLYPFDGQLKHILLAPITFDPSVQQIFLPLFSGGELYLVSKAMKNNPRELLEFIRTNQIGLVNTVPSVMNVLLNQVKNGEKIHLQYAIIAGETFSRKLYQRVKEILKADRIINIYGPTEAAINTTLYECREVENQTSIPIGKPLKNYAVRILDNQQKLLPIGVAGELCIAGKGLARGYLNQLELTNEKFIINPVNEERLYRTGDLARWLTDGNLEFLGRIDEQVKINGCRIELGEIEARMLEQPEIIDCTVFDQDGLYLIAFFTSESKLNPADLRQELAKYLPEYMLPASFRQVPNIPLTVNGKVDRKALAALLANSDKSYVGPANAAEVRMQRLWQEVLEIKEAGVTENFYQIGGNSLKAIALVAEIHKEFDVKLELIEVFNAPTIRELSAIVAEKEKSQHTAISKVAPAEYYPASHTQERMWILDQLKKAGEAYNISGAYLITGTLHQESFIAALTTLVERHESLRTTFYSINGQLMQKVHPEPKFLYTTLDYRQAADADALATKVAEKEAQTQFDLVNGPLFKTVLIELAEERHLFILTMHHIIADTWSMGVVFNELLTLYSAYSQGRSNPLPELKIQYKDYSAWQQQMLRGESLERHETYWRKVFQGPLPELELPADRLRPAVKTLNCGVVPLAISPEVTAKIHQFNSEHNMSLFMTLLSSVSLLLHYYTGSNDIIVNSLSAGRNHKDLENLVGFLVNSIPLRVSFDPAQSFIELAQQAKEVTAGAFEYQLYSFDSLVELLKLKREPNRYPLSDIGFSVFEKMYDVDFTGLNGVTVENYALDKQETINVDLVFEFVPNPVAITGVIKYSTDLFERPRLELMLARYLKLLETIFLQGVTELKDLDLRTTVEEKLNSTPDVDFDL